MKFYCINLSGHVGVQISFEENVATEHRAENKDGEALLLIGKQNKLVTNVNYKNYRNKLVS